MTSSTVFNRGWATLLTMVLALSSGIPRAESSPADWALDLLTRVEQWQSAGPLDFLPGRLRANESTDALQRVRAEYISTPIYFEPNVGQVAEHVKFLARGVGYALFLTADESVLALRPVRSIAEPETVLAVPGAVIRTRLEGATRNLEPQIEGLDRLRGISNYLIGNDPKQWRTNVPHYQRVRYTEVYPGIDLVYYGNPHQLEHDFIVAPGVDPAVIQLAISGAERVRVNMEGDLILTVPGGEVVQQAPRIYQVIDGRQEAVAGRYVLRNADLTDGSTASVAVVDPMIEALQVGFEIAQYDHQQPLIIDPVLDLVYSSFLGGIREDYGTGIAVDHNGHAYVTGGTLSSVDFPVEGGGGFAPNPVFKKYDAFVSKFDFGESGAASLLCSTYLGGSWAIDKDDIGYGVAVDGNGKAYVTGVTASEDFPTMGFTNLPPQLMPGTFRGGKDAFIVILDAQCGLEASTCWGGTKDEEGRGIAVHDSRIYVTGFTNSNFTALPGDEFPLANPFQPALIGGIDAFVSVLDISGQPRFSTYLGGLRDDKGAGIVVDDLGHLYITGSTASTNFPVTGLAFDTTLGGGLDGFVTKINPDWNRDGRYSVMYSSYLGGSSTDSGTAIDVDSQRYVYVTGTTASSNFPATANAAQGEYRGSGDAFVAKINPDATLMGMNSLVYATYLGGSRADSGAGIVVIEPPTDSIRIYITGGTASPVTTSPDTSFPITPDAADSTLGGAGDAFIAQLSDAGDQWVYVSYLGGFNGSDNGAGITANIDGSGVNVYVTGGTDANDFPFTWNAYYTINNNVKDAFVAKFQDLTFRLRVSPIGQGTVASNPAGISCDVSGVNCLTTYAAGTRVTLTATPVNGQQLVGWNGACSGVNPCTLLMNSHKDVGATFAPVDPATTLITHYYTSILGRSPEAVGLEYWKDQIVKKQAQGMDVKPVFRDMASFFFNSAEYVGNNTSDTQFITDLYRTFFQRAPDPGGMSFWLGELAAGVSRNDVMAGFLYSREFTTFMQSFGF